MHCTGSERLQKTRAATVPGWNYPKFNMLAILYELKDRKYVVTIIVHILIATIQRSVEDSRISSPNHEPSDFHKLLDASTDVWFFQQNKKKTNKLLRLEVNIVVLTVLKKKKKNNIVKS